jgi:hypothetical protein
MNNNWRKISPATPNKHGLSQIIVDNEIRSTAVANTLSGLEIVIKIMFQKY